MSGKQVLFTQILYWNNQREREGEEFWVENKREVKNFPLLILRQPIDWCLSWIWCYVFGKLDGWTDLNEKCTHIESERQWEWGHFFLFLLGSFVQPNIQCILTHICYANVWIADRDARSTMRSKEYRDKGTQLSFCFGRPEVFCFGLGVSMSRERQNATDLFLVRYFKKWCYFRQHLCVDCTFVAEIDLYSIHLHTKYTRSVKGPIQEWNEWNVIVCFCSGCIP